MSQQPDQAMLVAGNDKFLRNMFAEFMRIQATNTTPKSKSEHTADPEIFSGDGGNTEITHEKLESFIMSLSLKITLKESPAGLLTGSFLSLPKEKPLLSLMIQSLLFFQYTVESLKVHLSLLFYFFSIFQIFIILFIHQRKVYQLWALQMTQTFWHFPLLLKAIS